MMPSPKSKPALLQLPQEILDIILLEVSFTPQCLSSLARVCRRLHSLCNPLLYCLISLRDPHHGEKFVDTITNSPHLIPHIRGLQVHYHGTCDYEDDEAEDYFHDFIPAISHLHNLKSLVIKTDYFGEPDVDIFLQSHFLPALQCCNLGFDRSEFDLYHWSMRYWDALFCHPGIRTIVITGANAQLPGTWRQTSSPPRSTQLEELQLLNCEITASDVSLLLGYPRALKRFALRGQGLHDPNYTVNRDSDRSLYVDALKQHASSLESLDLDLYYDYAEPVDLSAFRALKSLTTTPRLIGGDDETGQFPWKSQKWDKWLSPSLEVLTFRDELCGFPLQIIYEKVCNGELPRLSRFTCEIREVPASELRSYKPSDIPPSPEEMMATKVKHSDMSFAQAFDVLGIRFSVVCAPETFVLSENEICPCDCWVYRHRLEGSFKYIW